MHLLREVSRPLSFALVLAILMVNIPINTVQAAMVATDTFVHHEIRGHDRARLQNFLARQDVQSAMQAQGISATEASDRVDSLSDAEISHIVGKLDELPAGSGAIEAIIGAAVLAFLVLLLTDLLGLTDIFPFVRN